MTTDKPKGEFGLDAQPESTAEYLRSKWINIKTGDVGSAPIVVGIVLILIIFRSLSENYLTAFNVVNMQLQAAGLVTIAIGVVFILLIAEIDLAIAFNSGIAGVLTVLLLRPDVAGWPWWAAILAGLVTSSLLSLVMGLIVTRAGVPSFVVTLAGNLALSGIVLILTTQFSQAGTIRIEDPIVVGIAGTFMAPAVSWILLALGLALSAFLTYRTMQIRTKQGLATTPMPVVLTTYAGVTAVAAVIIGYSNTDRGVPLLALIVGGFLWFWTFMLQRTRFGRHVLAIGGNPEAARRAGINVERVRVIVFTLAGFMAGAGGIILASRLRSVSPSAGGGSLLLDVIAAAVIGGTSLFGGRGRVSSALLGALVITLINNGMDGLGLNSGVKFVVTGLVLLGAVLLDALSNRRSTS
ncbi:MAG: ABC transporter permease [Acidimicrobiia bacterium]|nr:MAG: ABC transporter permease [Acidimicrobiia bacterium]